MLTSGVKFGIIIAIIGSVGLASPFIIREAHYQMIENADCQKFEYNLNLPEEEKTNEEFLQFLPRLIEEYEERCT